MMEQAPLAPDAVAELARQARAAGRLGIDTEFMGEGRYRTLLCVVQIAVPVADGLRVEVIDALDERLDPGPLAEVLTDPAVEVVLHSGRQDVALLRRVWHTEIRGLFDTQVAAGFAGLRAQAGYESLLREVLDVRLPKTASYTRWDRRPLTAEQLRYAREDVLHLLDAARALRATLERRGRLEWALEECRALESASDERDPDTLFARLPRVAGLDPGVRAVARELVAWREGVARAQDRPASTVLNDSALVEVARRRPRSPGDLEQVRGVSPGALRRRGDDLLEAVERGRKRPPIPGNGARRAPPADADAPLIALSESLIRTRALEVGVAYELLAARAELEEVVVSRRTHAPEPDVRALRGWRRGLVGAELLELLDGRHALRVGPDLRVLVERRGD